MHWNEVPHDTTYVTQISARRGYSRRLTVRHDGRTLLNKWTMLSKPYPGHCFVAWSADGVNFGVYWSESSLVRYVRLRTIVLRGDFNFETSLSQSTTQHFKTNVRFENKFEETHTIRQNFCTLACFRIPNVIFQNICQQWHKHVQQSKWFSPFAINLAGSDSWESLPAPHRRRGVRGLAGRCCGGGSHAAERAK